jgi:hypothetical protein
MQEQQSRDENRGEIQFAGEGSSSLSSDRAGNIPSIKNHRLRFHDC